MSKWQVCFEIDTDKDVHGDALGANYSNAKKCEDGEVLDFAQTFGAAPGDQWDVENRPYVKLLSIGQRSGWLIEWDGGWSTRPTEREAWIHVGELCADSEDSGYTPADFTVTRNAPEEAGNMGTADGLGEQLVCRTMGANLHGSEAEFEALLGHLQEGSDVLRRRIEVLLGKRTLAEVDAEASAEREGRVRPDGPETDRGGLIGQQPY